jgi:hypothetical protein
MANPRKEEVMIARNLWLPVLLATLAGAALAQPIPDMGIHILTYEERMDGFRDHEVLKLIDRQIDELENRGQDASFLRARRAQYWEEHVRPRWELEGGQRMEELKKELVFPKYDYVMMLSKDINPENAQKLVDELYRDFGEPNLNYQYLAGGPLNFLEYWAHQDLDPETRQVLVDGLKKYARQAIATRALPKPREIRELAVSLYRASTPEDDDALALSRSLFTYALTRAQELGYKDEEQGVVEAIQKTLDFDDAMLLLSEQSSAGGKAPADREEVKAARADFRRAIRNLASPALAEKVLTHLKRDWGNDAINEEMGRAYIRYGMLFVRFMQSPPSNIPVERLEKCASLLNQGMVALTKRNLTQASWNAWRALAIRMRDIASPELLRTLAERLGEVSADPTQEYAARSLRTALTALERR